MYFDPSIFILSYFSSEADMEVPKNWIIFLDTRVDWQASQQRQVEPIGVG